MGVKKEREAFEKHASKFFTDSKEAFKTNGDQYLYDEVIWMWDCWIERAKSQAVPEGFVVVEKSDLTDTYYWDGSEYVVDCPSDYEMELEQGEVITLEKWQRTKSTNVHFANIYTDEDNFDIVQFKTLEEAEQAIAENIAMIKAQEQSHD